MGGWSQPPATHIHDELHAKCVVLDDGRTRLALVIVDNIGMVREVCDAAKEMIQEQTGIPPEHVMIAGTHTHSSVSARGTSRLIRDEELDDYSAVPGDADRRRRPPRGQQPGAGPYRLGQRPGADAGLQPALFDEARHADPQSIRRRGQGEDEPRPRQSGYPQGGRPDRPGDRFLVGPVDRRPAHRAVGQLLAALRRPGTPDRSISADYFGVFGDRIQQLLGADRLDPPFVGIMSNGTSGDINNINWLKKPEKKWGPYEKMRQVAETRSPGRSTKRIRKIEFHDWVALAAAKRN